MPNEDQSEIITAAKWLNEGISTMRGQQESARHIMAGWRKNHGLSIQQFARLGGVSASLVIKLEKGERPWTTKTIGRFVHL